MRLFPHPARQFPGQRWLNILLRCLHLVGMAGIGAGFLFALSQTQWLPYWYLTLGSGVALCALYIWSSLIWLFQLKGLAILVKLMLLWIAMHQPQLQPWLFVLIVLISGLIAHAPGNVRGYLWLRIVR